jgi:hypothetical protein
MESKLDMSMMFAMHDALRRELVQVARTARLRDDHPGRLLEAAPVAMPWLLDGASPQVHEAVLSQLPPPVLAAFREQWEPRYATLNLWKPADELTS